MFQFNEHTYAKMNALGASLIWVFSAIFASCPKLFFNLSLDELPNQFFLQHHFLLILFLTVIDGAILMAIMDNRSLIQTISKAPKRAYSVAILILVFYLIMPAEAPDVFAHRSSLFFVLFGILICYVKYAMFIIDRGARPAVNATTEVRFK